MTEPAVTQASMTERDVLANLLYLLYHETFGEGVVFLDPTTMRYREVPLNANSIFCDLHTICGEEPPTRPELQASPIGPGDLYEMQYKLMHDCANRQLDLRTVITEVGRILHEARHRRSMRLAVLRDEASNHATAFGPGAPGLRAMLAG